MRFVDAYLSHATWERRDRLEARMAALLPALMLARIDGKSPVEYITDPAIKDCVRAFAGALLDRPEAGSKGSAHAGQHSDCAAKADSAREDRA